MISSQPNNLHRSLDVSNRNNNAYLKSSGFHQSPFNSQFKQNLQRPNLDQDNLINFLPSDQLKTAKLLAQISNQRPEGRKDKTRNALSLPGKDLVNQSYRSGTSDGQPKRGSVEGGLASSGSFSRNARPSGFVASSGGNGSHLRAIDSHLRASADDRNIASGGQEVRQMTAPSSPVKLASDSNDGFDANQHEKDLTISILDPNLKLSNASQLENNKNQDLTLEQSPQPKPVIRHQRVKTLGLAWKERALISDDMFMPSYSTAKVSQTFRPPRTFKPLQRKVLPSIEMRQTSPKRTNAPGLQSDTIFLLQSDLLNKDSNIRQKNTKRLGKVSRRTLDRTN